MSNAKQDLLAALQKVREGVATRNEADFIAWCLGTSDDEAKLALSRISAGKSSERDYNILKAGVDALA